MYLKIMVKIMCTYNYIYLKKMKKKESVKFLFEKNKFQCWLKKL